MKNCQPVTGERPIKFTVNHYRTESSQNSRCEAKGRWDLNHCRKRSVYVRTTHHNALRLSSMSHQTVGCSGSPQLIILVNFLNFSKFRPRFPTGQNLAIVHGFLYITSARMILIRKFVRLMK